MNIDFFAKRKTIRKYQKKDISAELLNSLIEAAIHAPTTGNMQLYSIIVSRKDETKALLSPTHFNQPMIKNAPVVLTFCADYNRFVKWCKKSNAVPGYNNLQSFIAAMLDTTIVAQQFVTIAEAQGLGCCYLGTTTYNASDIGKILNLPKMVIPIVTITVGYPENGELEQEQTDRLPISAVIHQEKYKDYDDDAIECFYKEKEALTANKRFVDENKKESLAQVFTDIRYTKRNNEIFSKIFFDYMNEQGFELPTV